MRHALPIDEGRQDHRGRRFSSPGPPSCGSEFSEKIYSVNQASENESTLGIPVNRGETKGRGFVCSLNPTHSRSGQTSSRPKRARP